MKRLIKKNTHPRRMRFAVTNRDASLRLACSLALMCWLALAAPVSTEAGQSSQGDDVLHRRAELLDALTEPSDEAVPALLRALDDDAPLVRRTAILGLVRLAALEGGALDRALAHEDPEIRRIAARHAWADGLDRADFLRLATDPDRRVRATLPHLLARFEAGETDREVDGWPGLAGDGWDNAWSVLERSAQASTIDKALHEHDEEAGESSSAARYARVRHTKEESEERADATLSRGYVGMRGLDLEKPYVIRMRVKFENLEPDAAPGAEGTFWLFEATSRRWSPGSNLTWRIDVEQGRWRFSHGDGEGLWKDRLTSDMAAEAGKWYEIEVRMRPGRRQWDATITGEHTSTRASTLNDGEPLGFRIAEENLRPRRRLHVGSRVEEPGGSLAWSVDQVLIKPAFEDDAPPR